MRRIIVILTILVIAATITTGYCCTSMLVSAKASATGRPLMWKHRDTGTEHNFIERVEARDGNLGYVALFNGGDSLLVEAWMGMNDAGFAVMNTASYNLAPDTTDYKDREGIVMSRALAVCRTVSDFAVLLDTLPKPLGVQANFGVMDADGNMAYFETDDHKYTRFDVADTAEGYIVRTNHSTTGNDTDGYGYVRYQNVYDILSDEMAAGKLSPQSFTEKASRSFWHSLLGRDLAAGTDKWVVDQDFIPRNISSASIVIEGSASAAEPETIRMWTVIGYPPCSSVQLVTLSDIPDGLRPLADGHRSTDCNAVLELKHKAFPIKRGNGKHYIDMEYLRTVMAQKSAESHAVYKQYFNYK